MNAITLSSREFNQDTGRAKRAADAGPVFITERGRVSHVLLTIEEFTRLRGKRISLAEALSCPAAADIDLDAYIDRREMLSSRPIPDFE